MTDGEKFKILKKYGGKVKKKIEVKGFIPAYSDLIVSRTLKPITKLIPAESEYQTEKNGHITVTHCGNRNAIKDQVPYFTIPLDDIKPCIDEVGNTEPERKFKVKNKEFKEEETLVRKLMKEFGLSDWRLKFGKAKTQLGKCTPVVKTITLSKYFIRLNDIKELENTIRHEIAHALDYKERGKTDHSKNWKKWAKHCGANPKSTCGESVKAPKKEYVHVCLECEAEIWRHRRSFKLISCSNCSNGTGFDPDYLFVTNIPRQVFNNTNDYTLLPQAKKMVKRYREKHENKETKFTKAVLG